MAEARNPLNLAKKSTVFPFSTLLVGGAILLLAYFYTQGSSNPNLGVVISVPFALLLVAIGIPLGVRSGVAAPQLVKGLLPSEKTKVLHYIWIGFAISLLEFGIFCYLLLFLPE